MKGWRAWARTTALPSFAQEAVLRSALCLKLHAYNDTGAIIAAATTSIPEAVGTERTWDYRFCWLRDAAFVVEALRRLSHLGEGEAFVRFLRDVADAGPLQPLYGIGGERELTEERLDHLAGFEGTQPVRVGNAAYTQVQTDLMGEMVLCLETLLTDPRVVHEDPTIMGMIEQLVDEAIAKYEVAGHGAVGVPHDAPALHVLEGDVLGGGESRRGAGRRLRQAGSRRRVGRVGARCSASAS